jgi:ribonucleoside-diphosphate reductase alpha chain
VYNGLSVLPHFGGSYLQAPFSDITKEEYDEKIKNIKSLDLTNVKEMDDNVEFSQVTACAGGSCSIE